MGLRVILVEDERERAMVVSEALRADGFDVVAILATGSDLPRMVRDLNAEVIVAAIDSPDRDILEDMRRVTQEEQRPVVLFSQDGQTETIRAAVEAGVSAYVVDGLRPERVKAVVDVAIAQFARFQDLRSQLDKAKATLAERKQIERAKGILMQRRCCGEEDAYRLMRKMAMDQKARIIDIANKIIEAAELLG